MDGDGFVTDRDLAIYGAIYRGELQGDIDFNGDGVVDIFDQTLIALEVIEVKKIYLPVIFR